MSNHHPDYKLWCLALTIARDVPTMLRAANPKGLKGYKDSELRRNFIRSFEDRHGKNETLRELIRDIWGQLQKGEEPVYTGSFQAAQIGKKQETI